MQNMHHAIACLRLVAASYRMSIDTRMLAENLRADAGSSPRRDLLVAVRVAGFKAKIFSLDLKKLGSLAQPLVLEFKNKSLAVLLRVQDDGYLLFDPQTPKVPLRLNRQGLEKLLPGKAIKISPSPVAHMQPFGLSWFAAPMLRYKKIFAEVLAASVLLQIFGLTMPLFSQVVIDKVLMHRSESTLQVLGAGMVILVIFEAVLSVLRSKLLAQAANRVDVILGARILDHVLKLPLRYFESNRSIATISKIRESETIRNFITGTSLTNLVDLAFTVVFLAVMWHYSVMLTVLVIASFPMLVGASLLLRPLIKSRLSAKSEAHAESQALLHDAVTGIHSVKASGGAPYMQRKWERALILQVTSGVQASNLSGISSALNHLIQRLITLAVLWVGAEQVMQGAMSIGQMIAFQMLALRVTHPMVRVAQTLHEYQQISLSAAELRRVMDVPSEVDPASGSQQLTHIAGEISLNKVVFKHPLSKQPILNGISMQAQPGQVIGIVGRSGCGKSTLAKLLQRLYLPDAGAIQIDGMDARNFELPALREQVCVVPQETFLFNGSIRDNICMEEASFNLAEVVEAAKSAAAHEFIMDLPEGYETAVGQRGGTQLSGGQRQRIAIARALYKKPKVLVLDEATSALDHETEWTIQSNLRNVCAGCTLIVIAHRLSTVRQADKIFVLDGGHFIEEGTHEELMARQGLYRQFHARQEAPFVGVANV